MKYSVLIIDDSDEDRYLLKRFLKKTELDVIIAEARNGEEALDFLTSFSEKYAETHPDIDSPLIAFLDVNMPIMNGWEFLEEFHSRLSDIQIKPTVVVMYSTSDLREDIDRGNAYEFVKTYLIKGEYTPEKLKETLVLCQQEGSAASDG